MRLDESRIREAFRIGLWLKAAHSVIEILGGVGLLLTTHSGLVALATAITAGELLEDPNDRVATVLRAAAAGFTPAAQSFSAWYLLGHGVVKLALAAGVLAGFRGAYPAFIAAMIGFIAYQLYRLGHGFSLAMTAITVLDVVVLALAVHEWRLVRRGAAPAR